MTDADNTTKPRPAIRGPFKVLGIIILGCFALAVGAAIFAPADKPVAAAPMPKGPLTQADAFTVLDVNAPPVNAPFIEVRVTSTDGVAANRSATVRAIADRVMHDRPDASAVSVYMQRSADSVTGSGNGDDLYGRIAEADYVAHPTGDEKTWKVWHSDDSQIISAHDIKIGNDFAELQDKMENAAGQNADIDAVDEKVRLAIIKKYKLAANWDQRAIPIANDETSDGTGPSNIDTSAAEQSLKAIDEKLAVNTKPARLGPHVASMNIAFVGCMVAANEVEIMAKVQHGDENGASVLTAQGVNAGVCVMKAEGAVGDVMTPENNLQDALIKVQFKGDNGILYVPRDFITID